MKQLRTITLFVFAIITLVACASAPSAESLGASSADSPMMAAGDEAAMSQAESIEAVSQASGESGTNGEVSAAALHNRKIIRNANIRIEADSVITALNQVTLLSTRYGGYTVSSRMWYENELPHVYFSFAVPVEQFEAALEETRHLGTVQDEQVSSQDVTGQFVDLEARIRNLEITAERIRGFLEETKTVSSALEVNRELSNIESQLEQVKGQRNALSQQTSFSTITVELRPIPPAPVTTGEVLDTVKAWSPVVTFNNALDVLLRLAQIGVDVVIWLAMLGIPALLILIVIWIVGRYLLGVGRRAMA